MFRNSLCGGKIGKMAAPKKNTDETKTAQQNTTIPDEFADCFGHEDLDSTWTDESMLEVHGWWKAEPGLRFTGNVVGAFQIDQKDRKRTVALVRLARPTKAVLDKKPIRLDPGQILGVSINHALTPMLNYVEKQGRVWAMVKGQKDVGQPQPMWVYELKMKGERTAPPALGTPVEVEAQGDEGDDFGF